MEHLSPDTDMRHRHPTPTWTWDLCHPTPTRDGPRRHACSCGLHCARPPQLPARRGRPPGPQPDWGLKTMGFLRVTPTSLSLHDTVGRVCAFLGTLVTQSGHRAVPVSHTLPPLAGHQGPRGEGDRARFLLPPPPQPPTEEAGRQAGHLRDKGPVTARGAGEGEGAADSGQCPAVVSPHRHAWKA